MELKPCPFCGGKAKLFSAKANAAGTRFVYWVECNLEGVLTCGCIPKTWQCDTAEEAIETWNRRLTMNDELEQAFREGYLKGKSEDSRIIQIANHYGYTAQSDIIIEECAELTQAICKLRRAWSDSRLENVKEELADVLIMARQLRVMLGANDIDEIINQKLDRQIERIAEEDKK